jgi:hypothetical protein
MTSIRKDTPPRSHLRRELRDDVTREERSLKCVREAVGQANGARRSLKPNTHVTSRRSRWWKPVTPVGLDKNVCSYSRSPSRRHLAPDR